MAVTRSEAAARNLREVEAVYRQKHEAAHRAFTAAYDELLGEFGLKVTSHADFHDIPVELHEALAPHKEALVQALADAAAEKHNSVAVERPRVNIVRALRR